MGEATTKKTNTQIYNELRKLWKFNPRKCLYSKECNERTIKAHSVPRSLLAGMQEQGHVLQPANRIANNDAGLATGQPIFEQVGINEASTGYFVCGSHDGLFRGIDTNDPDLSDKRILDLLMYRTSLKELWNQIRTIDIARSAGRDIPLPIEVNPEIRMRAISELATKLKDQIQIRNAEEQVDGIRTVHIIKHIKTDFPFLVAASAGSSSDLVIEESSGRVMPLEASRRITGREPNTTWTITVIPREKEHAVVISYVQGSYAENYFSHIPGASGADLQEAISAELLVFCENWFIHPTVWNSLGRKRQQAIQDTFNNFDKILTGEYDYRNRKKTAKWHEFLGITNRHQINLFRH